jgi:hypothetical protein
MAKAPDFEAIGDARRPFTVSSYVQVRKDEFYPLLSFGVAMHSALPDLLERIDALEAGGFDDGIALGEADQRIAELGSRVQELESENVALKRELHRALPVIVELCQIENRQEDQEVLDGIRALLGEP